MLGLCCSPGSPLVVEKGGYSPAVVCRLLSGVASLVEHRLQDTQASAAAACGLQSTSSGTVVQGHNCFPACGTFPDQGLNPCLLRWQADSLPRATREAPENFTFHWALWILLWMCIVRQSAGDRWRANLAHLWLCYFQDPLVKFLPGLAVCLSCDHKLSKAKLWVLFSTIFTFFNWQDCHGFLIPVPGLVFSLAANCWFLQLASPF